jgi:hypothetical protein
LTRRLALVQPESDPKLSTDLEETDMGAETSLRDTLNTSDLNRIASAGQVMQQGELMNALLNALAATETGVSVSGSKASLANQPTSMVKINATAGTTTGVKKLRIGALTGPNAIVPATGEAVWDGAKTVQFAAVDAVTTAAFTYTKASDVSVSLLQAGLDR